MVTAGRLFLLDLSGDRVVLLNSDGSDRKVIVTDCRLPDGIVIDPAAGHIYWTNMGNPKADDGSIERADLDGRNRKTIVPGGGTFTPKQLQLEKESGKVYWCDREGMRLMRANLDGSDIETLVDSSMGDPRPGSDPTNWCVGVAIDVLVGDDLLELPAAEIHSDDELPVRPVALCALSAIKPDAGRDVRLAVLPGMLLVDGVSGQKTCDPDGNHEGSPQNHPCQP